MLYHSFATVQWMDIMNITNLVKNNAFPFVLFYNGLNQICKHIHNISQVCPRVNMMQIIYQSNHALAFLLVIHTIENLLIGMLTFNVFRHIAVVFYYHSHALYLIYSIHYIFYYELMI